MNTSSLVRMGILYVFLTVAFLASTRIVNASEYIFKTGGNNAIANAQAIPEPQYQHYIYAKLSANPEILDFYTLNFEDFESQITVELLVPKSAPQNFHPQLIFSDPLSRRREGDMPFNFPSSLYGRAFSWPTDTMETATDNRTGEQFWVGPSFVKDMAPNKYTVAVYDPNGIGGTYILKIGAMPKADTWKDKILFLWSWVRIKLQLY